MTFAPGDVVMLKSGGHSMTVVTATDEEITCVWTTDQGVFFREMIPAIALEIVFSAADDDKEEDEDDEHEEDDDKDDEDEDDEDDEEEEASPKKRKR